MSFCYLLTPPRHTFSVDARRRLQAIESFSDLGSGIHIAMQDLDIRGAGNLLGAEQSGFIADLGYETYQKILKEAVEELKNDEFSDLYYGADSDTKPEEFVSECSMESDLDILYPANYVPQESERISLYQELDTMERETDIRQFCERLEDRFGRIPHEAMELIRVVRLRRLAKQLGIEKVGLKQGYMYLYFVSDERVAYYHSAAFGRILGFLQKRSPLVSYTGHHFGGIGGIGFGGGVADTSGLAEDGTSVFFSFMVPHGIPHNSSGLWPAVNRAELI